MQELKPTTEGDPTFGLVPRDLLREKHFENKLVAGDPHKFWYHEEQAVVSNTHLPCSCSNNERYMYQLHMYVHSQVNGLSTYACTVEATLVA